MNTSKAVSPNGNGNETFPKVRRLTPHNAAMRSRLERIHDWESLARDADYDAATVAALCPISLRQLERFFKLRFGISPRSWIWELQCRRARELAEQGYSNKAIVADLHFANESHLCHAFRKMYGCSPQTFAPCYGQSVAYKQERRFKTIFGRVAEQI